jgi:glutamine synthetase
MDDTSKPAADAAFDAQDEVTAFLAEHPDIKHVDAFIIELSGNPAGKRYPANDLPKLFKNGSQLCAGTYTLDVLGNSADPLGYGFSDGDPDADIVPVPGSLRIMPWSDVPRAQVLMRMQQAGTDTPVWFEPRHVLQTVVDRFTADGLRPVQALELEFYLTDPEREPGETPKTPISPVTGAREGAGRVYRLDVLDEFGEVLDAIEANCHAQGLPAQAVSSEYGPAQFEINLIHTDDPLKAADDAALMRRCVTETARAKGYRATFLSKPFDGESGNGLHIHVSVLDEAGENIFGADEARLGHAVAGLQAAMGESMALFAPHVNAFRRFEPNQFTPVTTDWGDNNRSMAFRIPASDAANRRIEHRIAGADANPYLTLAAVLAGVHHGLSNRLEPTAKASGNAGEAMDETLPFTLWDALARLDDAPILSDYLGADYVRMYQAVKAAEFRDFMAAIHPREYDWYL